MNYTIYLPQIFVILIRRSIWLTSGTVCNLTLDCHCVFTFVVERQIRLVAVGHLKEKFEILGNMLIYYIKLNGKILQ